MGNSEEQLEQFKINVIIHSNSQIQMNKLLRQYLNIWAKNTYNNQIL